MDYKEILDKKEETKVNFFKTQQEKSEYLGEYKENIVVALTKLQIEEDDIYPEIVEALKEKDISILKMRRDVSLKKLKPYIRKAEELKVRYQLVDGLDYRGDIALVVVSKKFIDNKGKNLVVRDVDQDFIDAGLTEQLSKARNKRICSKCMKKVEDKLPEYVEDFEKMGVIDRLIGIKCPGCIKIRRK